ncbi:MAG: hypothetical protein AB1938_08860 [Myxococcota bacterium]
MRRLALLGVLVFSSCRDPAPVEPVCGLHSASAPVVLEGTKDQALSVGARLKPGDRITAEGVALLECFKGALKRLDDETVVVGELMEAKVEATTIPRFVLKAGAPVEVSGAAPAVVARYSDNRFTPKSALTSNEPTSADYFRAFFTPNGIENMQAGPRPDGPTKLAPPSARPKVSRIHAGELGQGGAVLEVEDEVVFAETDDLATAALLEGRRYELGRTARLVLPEGAEAALIIDGQTIELEGPMDLRLR